MDESQVNVTLPEASLQTPLPNGWSVVSQDGLLAVMGPESDLHLSCLARPVVDDIAGLLHRVWREVVPGLDIPILQNSGDARERRLGRGDRYRIRHA
jgi:hypothetical protein